MTSPPRTTAAATDGSRSAWRARRARSSAGASESGARKPRSERARHELDGALDVLVVDLEMRDRAQHSGLARGGEADAGVRPPRDRVGRRQSEPRDIDLDEVRLD